MPKTEPRAATSISIRGCAHGNIYIRLHGPDGEIFAYGSLPPEVAMEAAENIATEVAEGPRASCAGVH